jgi:hypothetical protein
VTEGKTEEGRKSQISRKEGNVRGGEKETEKASQT